VNNEFRAWLGVARGRFLLLTLSCVALGIALAASARGGELVIGEAVLVLLGALAAHEMPASALRGMACEQ